MEHKQKEKEKQKEKQKEKEGIVNPPLTSDSNWKELEKQKTTSESPFELNGHVLKMTNIEKMLWHDVAKANLFAYYYGVSSYILPHLADRPLSLYIKHKGPHASGLYIKDMEGRQPEYAAIFQVERKHAKKGKRGIIDYLVCNNVNTLIYTIELGCIDVNPWSSRTASPDHPDWISIDLDPSDEDFSKAIEAALAAKEVFAKHKITAFPKTSGKTGIHLYIPSAGFDFRQVRSIAEHLCQEIHILVPSITTTEVSIDARGNRLYLDPNQNDYADTLAAPYSVRPYKIPTVSTPLEWKEINSKLDPHSFTIHTIMKRLEKKGDLFEGVLDEKVRFRNRKALLAISNKQ